MAIVGTILLAGVLSSGLLGIRNGWPFSTYPAFDEKFVAATSKPRPRDATRVLYQVEEITAAGHRRRLDLNQRLSWLPAVRRYTFVTEFAAAIRTHPDRSDLVHSFWRALHYPNGGFFRIRRVNIYRLVVSAEPSSLGRPLQRKLLATGTCLCDPTTH